MKHMSAHVWPEAERETTIEDSGSRGGRGGKERRALDRHPSRFAGEKKVVGRVNHQERGELGSVLSLLNE